MDWLQERRNYPKFYLKDSCKVSSLLFLFLHDCQEITEEAYINSHFKTHGYLKILNVAGNREALS